MANDKDAGRENIVLIRTKTTNSYLTWTRGPDGLVPATTFNLLEAVRYRTPAEALRALRNDAKLSSDDYEAVVIEAVYLEIGAVRWPDLDDSEEWPDDRD